MATHIETGLEGEKVAAAWLEERGFRVLERRFRCGKTDIDLVAAAPDGSLRFVEVKSRTRGKDGATFVGFSDFDPERAIDPAKARQLIGAAEQYMKLKGLTAETAIDLVAVRFIPGTGHPIHEVNYYADILR